MSSMGEKSQIMEKRSFFLRTGSFEKIKCSAKYPFRLAGIKLSKAALIELVDDIIVKARILSQRAFLIIFIAIFKMVSVSLSLVVDASANTLLAKQNICDNKDIDTKKGFYQRLQEKLQKLQKYKSRLDSLKKDDLFISSSNIIQHHSTPKIQKINSINVQEKIQINNINKNDDVTTKLSEFHDEITKLRNNCLSELSLSASSSTSSLSSISSFTSSLNGKKLQRICLFPIVYGSIVFMYLQLLFLAIALNTSSIPPGLIFLIGSLLFVGFITFKVFFIEKFRKIDLKAISRQQIKLQQSMELRKTVEALEELDNNKRQSRNRLKRVLDLNSKTLSKIKLL